MFAKIEGIIGTSLGAVPEAGKKVTAIVASALKNITST